MSDDLKRIYSRAIDRALNRARYTFQYFRVATKPNQTRNIEAHFKRGHIFLTYFFLFLKSLFFLVLFVWFCCLEVIYGKYFVTKLSLPLVTCNDLSTFCQGIGIKLRCLVFLGMTTNTGGWKIIPINEKRIQNDFFNVIHSINVHFFPLRNARFHLSWLDKNCNVFFPHRPYPPSLEEKFKPTEKMNQINVHWITETTFLLVLM